MKVVLLRLFDNNLSGIKFLTKYPGVKYGSLPTIEIKIKVDESMCKILAKYSNGSIYCTSEMSRELSDILQYNNIKKYEYTGDETPTKTFEYFFLDY